MESERERIQNLCSRESQCYWSGKTLFEEVSIKASFEGREGRAVTENEREIIQICAAVTPAIR